MRNRKASICFVFFVILFIAPYIIPSSHLSYLSTTISSQEEIALASENWLVGWGYRKNISITGSVGAGTNYQLRIDAHYDKSYSLTYQDNWADNAHQGVTTDSTYVYTSNTSGLTKYLQDGTYQTSRDTSGDGTYGDYIGDMVYVSGYLYVASHDSGFTDHIVMKYNASDLNYVTEYDVNEPDVSNWDGGFSIAYCNDSFWLLSDTNTANAEPQIQRYNSSFVYQEKWTFDGYDISGSWHYQGFDWLDAEYIFCTIHENSDKYIDIYQWTGSTFIQYLRIPQPSWTNGYTYTASQGLDIEEGTTNYIWFASRGGAGEAQQVGKYLLNIDDTDSGQEVYLDRKCQDDYEDIRFTDDDGPILLDYWREDNSNDSEAVFWVEVSDDLGTDAAIYIYYGNDEVSSISDGSDTFPFFDDWQTQSIQTSLWDIQATDGSVSWSSTDATHGYVIRVQGDPAARAVRERCLHGVSQVPPLRHRRAQRQRDGPGLRPAGHLRYLDPGAHARVGHPRLA